MNTQNHKNPLPTENNMKSDDIIEITLATAIQRIGAFVVDVALITVPITLLFLLLHNEWGALILSLMLVSIYSIVQILFISLNGQSLGKKIFGIKVIETNGDKAGFLTALLLREILFFYVCSLLIKYLIYLLQRSLGPMPIMALWEWPLVTIIQFLLLTTISTAMLFIRKDKRTPQDLFASTIVVKTSK